MNQKNIELLADIVLVRNHLAQLIVERSTIPKDKVRHFESIKSKFDKMFLDGVENFSDVPFGWKAGKEIQSENNSPQPEISNGVLVMKPVDDFPEEAPSVIVTESKTIDTTKAPAVSRVTVKSPTPEELEMAEKVKAEDIKMIAEAVAKAKKEIKGAKKASKFARVKDEDGLAEEEL